VSGLVPAVQYQIVLEMSEDTSGKVLVKRPSRIRTDVSGRSVLADPVESPELELVSTQMLKRILTSRDDTERKAVESAANTSADGVLARHPASGRFEVIDDEELQAILDNNKGLPEIRRPADAMLKPLHDYVEDDKLSLVSTQALRKVLNHADDDKDDSDIAVDAGGGFNPYDHG
jgi:hypothetical protein